MAFTISRRAFMTRTAVGSVAASLVASRRAQAGAQRGDAPLTHRFITANGIRIHLAEHGRGPAVLMCHGFPESWYSWRHQMPALAAAGFHAVAPDMRGYGQTDAPRDIDQYTILHLVGDVVGIADALGPDPVVIVGHDWGATVAWNAALLRPDRFRAIIALSVPFRPRGPARPTAAMPQSESAVYYQLYFQSPGVAEAELERDLRKTMRVLMPGESVPGGMVPRNGGWLDGRIATPSLPSWLTEQDLDFFVAEFRRTGFRGGLNYYRNLDRNWELMAPFAGRGITVPALFMAGDRDAVLTYPGFGEAVKNLSRSVPQLRKTILLPGCGHRTQQERAADVNAAMVEFLTSLSAGNGGVGGNG
jgi:epoxide hydrolase A/B